MDQHHSELRAQIARLGMTQGSLVRRMKQLGDDRSEKNILRSIQRMVSGDARVSGELGHPQPPTASCGGTRNDQQRRIGLA